MIAERLVLHADQQGHLTGLPTLQPLEEVEVIILRKEGPMPRRRRQPSPELAWRGAYLSGDDLEPAIPLEDWGELFQPDEQAPR
jgi:hypothetical protein